MYFSVINSIIDTCSDSAAADQLNKYSSRSSDLSGKSLKKLKKNEAVSISDLHLKRRSVAPSTTQV